MENHVSTWFIQLALGRREVALEAGVLGQPLIDHRVL
jgi:hypothetical protein